MVRVSQQGNIVSVDVSKNAGRDILRTGWKGSL